MTMNHPLEARNEVETARQLLRCVAPIPDADFEQVAYEVTRAYPNVHDEAKVQLIMTAVVKQWTTGIGCC